MNSQQNTIKNQLKNNNIAALKKLGQNFLISQAVLNKMIEAAQLNPNDTVLEIGPGLGVLTFELAKKAKQVIAVEKDKKVFQILKEKINDSGVNNVSLINEDALNFQFSPVVKGFALTTGQAIFNFQTSPNFQFSNYKIVANLPYNIATAIIMKFLESKNPPQVMVVMIQKEVGQRICAKPPQMNKLAVFCQALAVPQIIATVPPTAFYPKPKVDSAILKLSGVRPLLNLEPQFLRGLTPKLSFEFAKIVNAGFGHPRKTLLNNLERGQTPLQIPAQKEKIIQWLLQNNIQPSQRPQTLSVENWICLAKTLKKFHNK